MLVTAVTLLACIAALTSVASAQVTPFVLRSHTATPTDGNGFAANMDARRHGFFSETFHVALVRQGTGGVVAINASTAEGVTAEAPYAWSRFDVRCMQLFAISSTMAVCHNETVASDNPAVRRPQSVLALDIATGDTVWATPLFKTPLFPFEPMYAAGANPDTAPVTGLMAWTSTELVRIDPANGDSKWTWSLVNYCFMCFVPPSAMTYDPTTNVIVSGPCPSLGMLGHDATTGDLKWTKSVQSSNAPEALVNFAVPREVSNENVAPGSFVISDGVYFTIYVAASGGGAIAPVWVYKLSWQTGDVLAELRHNTTGEYGAIPTVVAPVKAGNLSIWLAFNQRYEAIVFNAELTVNNTFTNPNIGMYFATPIQLTWGGVAYADDSGNFNIIDSNTQRITAVFETANSYSSTATRNSLRFVAMRPADAAAIARGEPGNVYLDGGILGFSYFVGAKLNQTATQQAAYYTSKWQTSITMLVALTQPLFNASKYGPLIGDVLQVAIATFDGAYTQYGFFNDSYTINLHNIAKPISSDVNYVARKMDHGHVIQAWNFGTNAMLWSVDVPYPVSHSATFIRLESAIAIVEPSGVRTFSKFDGTQSYAPVEDLCGQIELGNYVSYSLDPTQGDTVWFTAQTGCMYRLRYPSATLESFPMNRTMPQNNFAVSDNGHIVQSLGDCTWFVAELQGDSRAPVTVYPKFTIPDGAIPASDDFNNQCDWLIAGDRLVILVQVINVNYDPGSPSLVSYALGGFGAANQARAANLSQYPLWWEHRVLSNSGNGDPYSQNFKIQPYNGTLLVINDEQQTQGGFSILAVADDAPADGRSRLLWSWNCTSGEALVAGTFDPSTACIIGITTDRYLKICFANVSPTSASGRVVWEQTGLPIPPYSQPDYRVIVPDAPAGVASNGLFMIYGPQANFNYWLCDGFTGTLIAKASGPDFYNQHTAESWVYLAPNATPWALLPQSKSSLTILQMPNLAPRMAVEQPVGLLPQPSPTLAPGYTQAPIAPSNGPPPPAPGQMPPADILAPQPNQRWITQGQMATYAAAFNDSFTGGPVVFWFSGGHNTLVAAETGNTVNDDALANNMSDCIQRAAGRTTLFCLRYELFGRRLDLPANASGAVWRGKRHWPTTVTPAGLAYDPVSRQVCVVMWYDGNTTCYDELTGETTLTTSAVSPTLKKPAAGRVTLTIVSSTLIVSAFYGGVQAVRLTGAKAGQHVYSDFFISPSPGSFVTSLTNSSGDVSSRFCYSSDSSTVVLKCLDFMPDPDAPTSRTLTASARIGEPISEIFILGAAGFVARQGAAFAVMPDGSAGTETRVVTLPAPLYLGSTVAQCEPGVFGLLLGTGTATSRTPHLYCMKASGDFAWKLDLGVRQYNAGDTWTLSAVPTTPDRRQFLALRYMVDTSVGQVAWQLPFDPFCQFAAVVVPQTGASAHETLTVVGTVDPYQSSPPHDFINNFFTVEATFGADFERYDPKQKMIFPTGDKPANGLVVAVGLAGIVMQLNSDKTIVRSGYIAALSNYLASNVWQNGNSIYFHHSAIVQRGTAVTLAAGDTFVVAPLDTLQPSFTTSLSSVCVGAASEMEGVGRHAVTFTNTAGTTSLAFTSGTCLYLFSSEAPTTLTAVNLGVSPTLYCSPVYVSDTDEVCVSVIDGSVVCYSGTSLAATHRIDVTPGYSVQSMTTSNNVLYAGINSGYVAAYDMRASGGPKAAWASEPGCSGFINGMTAVSQALVVECADGVGLLNVSAGVAAAPSIFAASDTKTPAVLIAPKYHLALLVQLDQVQLLNLKTGNIAWTVQYGYDTCAAGVFVPEADVAYIACASSLRQIYNISVPNQPSSRKLASYVGTMMSDMRITLVNDTVVTTANGWSTSWLTIGQASTIPGPTPAMTTAPVRPPSDATLPPAATSAPIPTPQRPSAPGRLSAEAPPLRLAYHQVLQNSQRCFHPVYGALTVGFDGLELLTLFTATGGVARRQAVAPINATKVFNLYLDPRCSAAFPVYTSAQGLYLPWIAVDPVGEGILANVTDMGITLPAASPDAVVMTLAEGLRGPGSVTLAWTVQDSNQHPVVQGFDARAGTSAVWSIVLDQDNVVTPTLMFQPRGVSRLIVMSSSALDVLGFVFVSFSGDSIGISFTTALTSSQQFMWNYLLSDDKQYMTIYAAFKWNVLGFVHADGRMRMLWSLTAGAYDPQFNVVNAPIIVDTVSGGAVVVFRQSMYSGTDAIFLNEELDAGWDGTNVSSQNWRDWKYSYNVWPTPGVALTVVGAYVVAMSGSSRYSWLLYTGASIYQATFEDYYDTAQFVPLLQASNGQPLYPTAGSAVDRGNPYVGLYRPQHGNVEILSLPDLQVVTVATIDQSVEGTAVYTTATSKTEAISSRDIQVLYWTQANIGYFTGLPAPFLSIGVFPNSYYQTPIQATGKRLVNNGNDALDIIVTGGQYGLTGIYPNATTAFQAPSDGGVVNTLALGGNVIIALGSSRDTIQNQLSGTASVQVYKVVREAPSGQVTGVEFAASDVWQPLCPDAESQGVDENHSPVFDAYNGTRNVFFFTAATRCLFRVEVDPAATSAIPQVMAVTVLANGDSLKEKPLVTPSAVVVYKRSLMRFSGLDRSTMAPMWTSTLTWSAVQSSKPIVVSNNAPGYIAVSTDEFVYCMDTATGGLRYTDQPVVINGESGNGNNGLIAIAEMGLFASAFDTKVQGFSASGCAPGFVFAPTWTEDFGAGASPSFPKQEGLANSGRYLVKTNNGQGQYALLQAESGPLLWSTSSLSGVGDVQDAAIHRDHRGVELLVVVGSQTTKVINASNGALMKSFQLPASGASSQWGAAVGSGALCLFSSDQAQGILSVQLAFVGEPTTPPPTMTLPPTTVVPTTPTPPTPPPTTTTTTATPPPTVTTTSGPASPTTTSASTTTTSTASGAPVTTPPPTPTGPTTTPGPTAAAAAPDDSGLSKGAVAGVVIAALVTVGIGAIAVMKCTTMRRQRTQPVVDYDLEHNLNVHSTGRFSEMATPRASEEPRAADEV